MEHELAIANAALFAALFRADPTPLTRPDAEAFLLLLDSALVQCSRPNVQKCRSWIVDNIAVSSTHRATALGKYLAALASKPSDRGRRISLKRWRLHILYLLNDVVHHLVTRLNNHKLESAWEAHLPALFAAAADFDQCPKHKKKLENLLDLWQEKSYFSASFIAKLRDALANGVSPQQPLSQSISNTSVKLSKDTPFILPALHGDPSTPWFDLPASTWLMHMEANSTKPMKPEEIKPLQLKAGPASQKLVAAVQDLLADADFLFSKESQENNDEINELGERTILDDVTGEIVGGETYYGWSRRFCEQMKDHKRKAKNGKARRRSRSRSRSRSMSMSDQDSRRRSLSPDRASFRSRRYSDSPPGRGRSSSRSRSPDSRHFRRRSYSRSPSRSRSRSRSSSRSRSRPRQSSYHNRPPPPAENNFMGSQPPPPLPPSQHPFPPFPPPPPTGYTGPWPPPPPNSMGGPPANWFPPIPPVAGGWGSAPPPPPPPSHHPHYQGNNFGRGNDRFRGRGRGGYDRGGRGW